MVIRKAKGQFPRKPDLPSQSAKYWAKEKDRYLRQLLISDIEDETGRELIVYYSRLDQQISWSDAEDIAEILDGVSETGDPPTKCIDLMLHTLGGYVDAVEKFNSVLKSARCEYRVIVPCFAKSGGTLIALASNSILMGPNSELGPIDPQIDIPDLGIVVAQYVMNDDGQPHTYREIAKAMHERAQTLAIKYLSEGMMKSSPQQISQVVERLCSYGSHGAVIDYNEATNNLLLTAQYLEPSSDLWRRIWLLYCMYDADATRDDLGKIFEGAVYSLQRKPV